MLNRSDIAEDFSLVGTASCAGRAERSRWGSDALAALKALIGRLEPRFPCIYGARALRSGALSYTLVGGTDADALDELAVDLEHYLASIQHRPDLTSLLAIFPPEDPPFGLDVYRRRFWKVLGELHERDTCAWPAEIPTDPEDGRWEFCFGGEPIFVFASCPAYEQRRSRRTDNFMIAFQPRYMFERLVEKRSQLEKALTLIRKRVVAFDDVPPHPAMGLYGEDGNVEWRQYMLPDTNEPIVGRCPMHFDHDR